MVETPAILRDVELSERLREYANAFEQREQDWPFFAHLLRHAASRIDSEHVREALPPLCEGVEEAARRLETSATDEIRAAHEVLDLMGAATHAGPDQGDSGPVERLSLAQRIWTLRFRATA